MLRTSPAQTLSSKVNAEVGAVLAGQTGRAHRGATHLTADARPGLNPGHLPPGRHRQSFSPKCSSFLEVPYQMRVLEPCAHTHPCTPRSGAQLPRPSSGRASPTGQWNRRRCSGSEPTAITGEVWGRCCYEFSGEIGTPDVTEDQMEDSAMSKPLPVCFTFNQ